MPDNGISSTSAARYKWFLGVKVFTVAKLLTKNRSNRC